MKNRPVMPIKSVVNTGAVLGLSALIALGGFVLKVSAQEEDAGGVTAVYDHSEGGQGSDVSGVSGQMIPDNASGSGYAPEGVQPSEDAQAGEGKEDGGTEMSQQLPQGGSDGWVMYDGGWYFFRGGSLVSGWLKRGNSWYYLDDADSNRPYRMVAGAAKYVGGAWYDFNDSGEMATGWTVTSGGRWAFHYSWGGRQMGWLSQKGIWYYLDPNDAGLMVADKAMDINGAGYFFGGSGAMLTGWRWYDGGWHYHLGWGGRYAGWFKDGGTWYYLDPGNHGMMAADKVMDINGATYFFGGSGAMLTGWRWYGGGWHYHLGWGGRYAGWFKDGGTWYYLDPENHGMMAADKVMDINGVTYFFGGSGAMLTGWRAYNGGWYYHLGWGGRYAGWFKDGGTWYYLDPQKSGKMSSDGWSTVGGGRYFFHSSGAMATGWISRDGGWYYLGSDGAMKTGWQNTPAGRYYLYKDNDPNGGTPGMMAHDVTIDGISIPSNGNVSAAFGKAGKVLDQVGWDLYAAFKWSAGMHYVNVAYSPDPGAEYFANYGFDSRMGDCYVMASTFYYMAKALGYDAHWMAGYVPLRNGGTGVHSWVEIDINGGTYVFDPDFTNETGRSGYWFTYGMSGTWRYMDYKRMN